MINAGTMIFSFFKYENVDKIYEKIENMDIK